MTQALLERKKKKENNNSNNNKKTETRIQINLCMKNFGMAKYAEDFGDLSGMKREVMVV